MFAVLTICALAFLQDANVARAQEKQTELRLVAMPLMHHRAESMRTRLIRIMGEANDFQITCDEVTNTLFIRASEGKIQQAREIIDRVDQRVRGSVVITFKNMKLSTAVASLKALLVITNYFSGYEMPYVAIDEQAQAVILLGGHPNAMQSARTFAQQLDAIGK